MTTKEQEKIENSIEIIDKKAKEIGLDYYDTEFLIAEEELMDQIRTYVLPVRYHHWTFGQDYQRNKTLKKHGLSSKIYECVINSDPAYAFLLEKNNLTEMKVVIAHVLGHVDFFKNNILYNQVNKRMATECALNAKKIADYSSQYGEEKVEKWIDACMSISKHCELSLNNKKENQDNKDIDIKDEFDFMFRKENIKKMRDMEENKPSPIMEKDLLLFLLNNRFSDLEGWQKDVMSIVRDEMRYFIPNIQTKIINEGFSTFFHQKILEELDNECDFLKDDGEDWYIYYSAMNSSVLGPGSLGRINPYLLGYTIWKNIYEKTEGSEKDKIEEMLDIRATHTDALFIKNYLTEEIVEDLDLFIFSLLDDTWTVTETTNWTSVRDLLYQQLIDAHIPTIYVVDDDYNNNRELLLMHDYNGDELEYDAAIKTLGNITQLWKRPASLRTAAHLTYETEIDDKNNKKLLKGEDLVIYLNHDGKKSQSVLAQEKSKPVLETAKDYFNAKYRKNKFENKIKDNLYV